MSLHSSRQPPEDSKLYCGGFLPLLGASHGTVEVGGASWPLGSPIILRSLSVMGSSLLEYTAPYPELYSLGAGLPFPSLLSLDNPAIFGFAGPFYSPVWSLGYLALRSSLSPLYPLLTWPGSVWQRSLWTVPDVMINLSIPKERWSCPLFLLFFFPFGGLGGQQGRVC